MSDGHLDKESGNTDGSRASADEDDLLILKSWNAWNAGGGIDCRCCDRGCTFDIIVEAVAPPAEVVEKAEGGLHLEVFELNEASWAENFLDSVDEFLDNWELLLVGEAGVVPSVVEWILDDLLAVCSDIQLDRKGVLWRNGTDEGVEDELTDWDTEAGSAEISETKDTATVGNDDAADVLAWEVAEDFFHVSFVLWGDVNAAVGLAVGGPFHAGFTDSWGVKNWHGLDWWVCEEEAPEGTLILFTFVGEEDVLEHWGWHNFKLALNTGSLLIKSGDLVWKKTTKVETITFFTVEASSLVKIRIFKKIHSNLA